MPDRNDPQYNMIVPGSKLKSGITGLLAGLAENAGVPTKAGLQPLEGFREIGRNVLAGPANRYTQAVEAAKTGLEAKKTQAETGLEEAETAAKQAEIGKPKPIAEDKTVFTGPDDQKLTVQGYDVGGKTVYGVVGGGAPTADSPTNAQDALAQHLSAQAGGTPPAEPLALSTILPRPLGAGALPTVPPQTRATTSPTAGWTAGEPTPEQRPATPQEIEAIRGSIGADPDVPKGEKDALLSQLRTGMTSKELDSVSARYDSAAARSAAAGISEKDRLAAAKLAEDNRRADKAAAEADKQTEKDQEPIIAFDPKTKERIYTTRGEGKAAGLTMTGGKAVTEAEVGKEEAATRQFNDVQMNVSRYKNTYAGLKGPLSKTDLNNMTAILSLTQQLERPGEGGFTGALSAGYVPALANSSQRQSLGAAWSKLSPEATELVTGYLRAKGAIPAYQRALTGTGRTSQAAMEIEMANLPEPTVGYTKASSQLKAFQENIDTASKGLTRFPWLPAPQEVRQSIEGPTTTLPQGAIPGTMGGKRGYVLNGEFHAQ
jgi:hypothetical protein